MTKPRVAARRLFQGVWLLFIFSSFLTPGGPSIALTQESTCSELLVLLQETDEQREELPVFRLQDDRPDVAASLCQGFSGKMLRIYQYIQRYLQQKEGIDPEPAYLLLSSRQGGFARVGFFLEDQEKRHSGYVDVHRDWDVTGRFGAIDQIYPHELAHVIRRQLVGELAIDGTNQVHALGVRTGPVVALNEGFAEHFQVMAVDDPDAAPETRALAEDSSLVDLVHDNLNAYRRELFANFSFVSPKTMTFILWYSQGEDVLRYHAVKANAFARTPQIPPRLLQGEDPYAAYLIENIFPGSEDDPPKTVARMVASEAVISTLFHRWATDQEIANRFRDDSFYEPFGVSRSDVTPMENTYLKIAHVFYQKKPQRPLEVVNGYRAIFADEADLIDAVVADVFLNQQIVTSAEIWLANPHFQTGTTMFDQFRGLPRLHTFDLNAASLVDLVAIPGVDIHLAEELIANAPYETLSDITRVKGISAEIEETFQQMSKEMENLLSSTDEAENTLTLATIFKPYGWRALIALGIAAIFGAASHRRIRKISYLRAAVNGIGAGLLGLIVGWLITPFGGLCSLAAVVLIFGVPGALWKYIRGRKRQESMTVLLTWLLTAIPAAVMVTPW